MRTKQDNQKQCEYVDRPDISTSEKSHFSKVYGINQSSILLEIPDFNVTQQLPQDIMHVLLEGIFPFHMQQLLNYIINEAHILSLDQVNSRILAFPYSYFDCKPSPIESICLQS